MGYYNTLAKTKKADMEQLTLIYVADKSVNLFLENSLAESIMGNCKSCCLRIPFLGIYLTKIDVYLSEDFYKNICNSIYIVASHWEQTQCLSAKTVTFLDLLMDKWNCGISTKLNTIQWTICDNMDQSHNLVLSIKVRHKRVHIWFYLQDSKTA